MTIKFNLHSVLLFRPCYSREKIDALRGGREEMSYQEVLELPIPEEDLVWLLWRGPNQRVTQAALNLTMTRASAYLVFQIGDFKYGAAFAAHLIAAEKARRGGWQQEKLRQLEDFRSVLATQGQETASKRII